MSPVLTYYLDVTMFNVGFSIIIGLATGIFFSLIIFSTIGVWVGLKAYNYIYSNQYYIYYNLGYSKRQLIAKILVLNTFISLLLLLLYYFVIK